MKTPLAFASVALLPLLTTLSPTAAAQEDTAEERFRHLRQLVDPAVPDGPLPSDSDTNHDLAKTVAELIAAGNQEALSVLGTAAVPALLAEARAQSISGIASANYKQQPLTYLREAAPKEALELLTEFAKSDHTRLLVLVRAGLTPLTSGRRTPPWGSLANVAPLESAKLIDAVVQSTEISDKDKLAFACGALDHGAISEVSRKLIRRDLLAARSAGLQISALPAIVDNATEIPAPLALELLEDVPFGAFHERLLNSEDGVVLGEAIAKKAASGIPDADVRKLLMQHLDDENPNVAAHLSRAAVSHRRVLFEGSTVDDLIRIVRFAHRTSLRDHDFCQGLAFAVSEAISSSKSREAAAELATAVFASPNSTVGQVVGAALLNASPFPSVALAVYGSLVNVRGVPQGELSGFLRMNRPKARSAARSEHIARAMLLHSPATPPSELQVREKELIFVPPSLQPAVLKWLGGTESNWDETAVPDVALWKNGGEAFRGAAFGEGNPWKERAIGIVGLYVSGAATSNDTPKCAAILAEALSVKDQREQFLGLLDETGYVNGPLPDKWNELVARIYATKGVSSEAKEQLPISRIPTAPAIIQSMLDIAAAETDSQAATIRFRKLAGVAAPLAAINAVKIKDESMANWLRHADRPDDLVTSVLEGGSEFPIDVGRTILLERITGNEDGIVNQVLRFPGEDTTAALIDRAIAINSSRLTSIVRDKVQERLELRKLKRRLLEGESSVPTIEDALQEVIAIVETNGHDGRMEAIRAVQTLNALEAIPALIGVVTGGTEEEKKLAREVLAEMNARARATLVTPEAAGGR